MTSPTAASGGSAVLLFLGCERSGTTLVQNTLARHYDVASGNESQWVVRGWRRLRGRRLATRAEQELFLRWIFADWYFANMANYHQVLFDFRAFVQPGPFDWPTFVEAVFRHIAESRDRRWVLNKTCDYCYHLPAVDETFRRPRIAHLIRDGRDVALSLIRTKAWGPKNPYAAGRYWAAHVDGLQRHASELGDRYLELRYEDLLANPADAFERLARFYGIFDPARHAELVAALAIRPEEAGKWRSAFSPREVELLERGAGETLVRNGYEPVSGAAARRPLPAWRAAGYRAHSALASRLGFYPLWFRALRIVNRLIGLSPALQRRFYASAFFREHFHWNRVLKRRGVFR